MKKSLEYIQKQIGDFKPEVGLILGSGLGILADEIKNKIEIGYDDIPEFPKSTVHGHKGQLVLGELEGKKVIAMQGRFHYYEGYKMTDVTMPVRVMKLLGVDKLMITNAAGGVNKEFKPGDLMLITDHINFGFDNPLMGKNMEEFGPRFPDMSHAYNPELIAIARKSAKNISLDLQEGVYMFFTGPTYETPAEIRMARILGADAVGMSTVPEVIAAVHSDMKVIGISCITNMAAGILDQPLNHEEVIETTQRVKSRFIAFAKEILKNI
ncbi:purine-nucleoside phosphorylase [Clostridiaceae bacterium M8S5]|nr:purine-nucleoside phosphorylase [Clostridiaceae bacterium M8S5]